MTNRSGSKDAALKRAQDSLQAIFNASSEGLALCRLIRDEEGRVVDYQVLDVNPAHRRLTGATREQMLTKPVSQVAPPVNPRWFKSAEDAVQSGLPQTFEVRSPATGLWLDIHVSPVSDDLFAQTFIDVTARHDLEDQRARLITEMNHRVMNNFQLVASVLNLQARRSSDPNTCDQLTNAVRRVQLLAELHEQLALTPDAGKVDFEAYLTTVCHRLRASIAETERIRLILETEPAVLDTTLAIPLGFVVNELVTNAIKYAFPPPATGDIIVSFRREPSNFLLLIADGGIGLPSHTEPKGAGLGMRLVGAFVEQIGGTLDVDHKLGVAYSIRFSGLVAAERHA